MAKSKKVAPKVKARSFKITVKGFPEAVSETRDVVLAAPSVTFVIRKARTVEEARTLVLSDKDRRSVLRKTGIPVDAVRKAKVERA